MAPPLIAAGMRLYPVGSLAEGSDLAVSAGPLVVEVRDQDTQSALRRMMLGQPDLAVIAAVSDPMLLDKDGAVPYELLAWPSEARRLVRSVLECRFRAWAAALEYEVVCSPHLDPPLQAALRYILDLRLLPPTLDGSPPDRTIEAAARATGLSRRRLSDLARSAGVPMRFLADLWIALLALFAHEINGAGWDELAFRAGYEGLSGLSELAWRVFGRRLRQLSGVGVEEALRLFEAVVLPPTRRTKSSCCLEVPPQQIAGLMKYEHF